MKFSVRLYFFQEMAYNGASSEPESQRKIPHKKPDKVSQEMSGANLKQHLPRPVPRRIYGGIPLRPEILCYAWVLGEADAELEEKNDEFIRISQLCCR